MKNVMSKLFIVFVAFVLTSCANSASNKGVSDAALSGDPSAMWEDGKKIAKQGEELTGKGEKQVNKGRAQVRKGEERIQKANGDLTKIRIEYQTAANQTGRATSPKGVNDEAKALKKIGSRWDDAIDDIRSGNKMIDAGNEAVDKGQTTIRKGRTLVDEGSTLMRNSKRLELGTELLPVTIN